ncbi:MAG: PEGA domain-containing protein [Deltaproteobacteria bacterium]|nr:PEGA domain-containing protein [Deltaproteobacteria bacterium]
MRSTSSARRGLALFLCVLFALQGAGTAGWAAAERPPEPCLLLKLSSPSVPEDFARGRMAPLPALLLRELNVRWVAPPAAAVPPDIKAAFPDADDASLDGISRTLADALRQMDRMEMREAERSLSKAENDVRKFRIGVGTRPLLAEIFMRRGQMKLWEGNPAGAEEMFARSRAMRNDFSPDPALFSPSFLEVWERSKHRPAPEAELLVRSIPPGASVSVDGTQRGATPCRIRVSCAGPVRIRVSLAGYQDVEKAGQWLPGDSESLEWILGRDRIATLGDLIAAAPDGKGTGKLLHELASAAGASRTALVVLEDRKGKTVARVLSSGGGDADPALLGEFEWPQGDDGIEEAAGVAAKLLRDAGWPPAKGSPSDPDSPWYHKWWIWVFIGAVAVGLAAGGGGGGGSSGGSSGTIGVSF